MTTMKIKKAKGTKNVIKCVIKKQLKFEDYKDYLQAAQLKVK